MGKNQSVCVLMATYNGYQYLREQIDSVLAQEGVDIKLYVSDDHSCDDTVQILEQYKQEGKLVYTQGVYGSPQANFYHLINTAPDADYYALCDQDDYWMPEKLIRAIEKMESDPNQNLPLLYYGTSTATDSNLNVIPTYSKSFGVDDMHRAVIVSNAQGCTMVFNDIFLKKIRGKTSKVKILHDGWLHKTCLVLGGRVIYDPNSYMLYRQHNHNAFSQGGKNGFAYKMCRKLKMIGDPAKNFLLSALIEEWLQLFDEEIREDTKQLFSNLLACNEENINAKRKVLCDKRIRSNYRIEYCNFVMRVLRGKL